MTSAKPSTIHATCVAIGGQGVLIMGPSGIGKSDLALRLIDRGATLVSDDYTEIELVEGALTGRPPATIAGKIEVRGVGIVTMVFAGKRLSVSRRDRRRRR
jgi:serine kinase of HPr protein (carbohydrate metabolism regulator)